MVKLELQDSSASALVHRARAPRLQVRRDADAHLTRQANAQTTAAGPGPLQRF
jgi:hypothetical protein